MSDIDFIDIILASSSRDSSPSTVYPSSPFAATSSSTLCWSSTRSFFPTIRPRPTGSPSLPRDVHESGRFEGPSSEFSDDDDDDDLNSWSSSSSRQSFRLRRAPPPPRRWQPRNTSRSNHIPMFEPEQLGLWTVKEEEGSGDCLMVPVDQVPSSRPDSTASSSSAYSIPDSEMSVTDLFFIPPPPTRQHGALSRRSTRTPSPLMLLTPESTRRVSSGAQNLKEDIIDRQQHVTVSPCTPISSQQSREMQRIIDSCPELSPCSRPTPRSTLSSNTGTGKSPASVFPPTLLPALPILSPENFHESRLVRCFRSSSNASSISTSSTTYSSDLVTPISPSMSPSARLPAVLPPSDRLSHVFEHFLQECDELPATGSSSKADPCAPPPRTPHDRPRTPPRKPCAPRPRPPKSSQALQAAMQLSFDDPPPPPRIRGSRSPLQNAASLQYDSRRRPPKSSRALQAALGIENNDDHNDDETSSNNDLRNGPKRLPGRPGLPLLWTNRI